MVYSTRGTYKKNVDAAVSRDKDHGATSSVCRDEHDGFLGSLFWLSSGSLKLLAYNLWFKLLGYDLLLKLLAYDLLLKLLDYDLLLKMLMYHIRMLIVAYLPSNRRVHRDLTVMANKHKNCFVICI